MMTSCGGSSNTEDLTVTAQTAIQSTVYYVSTAGNDNWSGTLAAPNASGTDGPFATLTEAQTTVRAVKASATQPVTVYVREGVYYLSTPLVFTPQDSGTAALPITYEAYPNETPVLSGGVTISGWQAGGTVGGNQIYTTQVPAVASGSWYFHELFVNGVRRTRARTPNTGFYNVNGTVTTNGPSTFQYNAGNINPAWAGTGAEVVLLQYWEDTRSPIASVNSSTSTVTLAGSAYPYASQPNAPYWVENTITALDSPGEWYLNSSTGVLSYIPMAGENITQVQVVAPTPTQLILFEGNASAGSYVSNLVFKGLTFQYTDWSETATGYSDIQSDYDVPAAVQGTGVSSITIENCTFSELGQYAIALGGGAQNNVIQNNVMTDLGAGGVKIGDPTVPSGTSTESFGNVVSNNQISNIGTVYTCGAGVWVGESSGNTISHNAISGTYNTAISVGWTWGYGTSGAQDNLIEYNLIYNIGQGVTSDMGGVYTLGVQPGTIINNNVIYNVSSYSYGGWGIYLDEGSSDIVVENNVVYNATGGGFDFHFGENDTIENNIFALGTTAEIIRTTEDGNYAFNFEHNIVYWTQGPLLSGAFGDGEYFFDYNLYYLTTGGAVTFDGDTLAQWRAQGQDVHSRIANPLFVSPTTGNFSLAGNSPAFSLGFQAINDSTVGPQP
jgi:parallel beta-helix repeat protein